LLLVRIVSVPRLGHPQAFAPTRTPAVAARCETLRPADSVDLTANRRTPEATPTYADTIRARNLALRDAARSARNTQHTPSPGAAQPARSPSANRGPGVPLTPPAPDPPQAPARPEAPDAPQRAVEGLDNRGTLIDILL